MRSGRLSAARTAQVSGAAPATARKEKTVDIFDTSLGDSEEEEEEGANGHAARWKTREEASVDDRVPFVVSLSQPARMLRRHLLDDYN